jgi:integrase
MASVSSDGGGRKRILFADGDGNRPAIRLGKATKNQAEKFKDKVESLIAGKITGAPVDDEVSRWLAALPDTMHKRLVAVGLAKPRQAETIITLRNLSDEFFAALKAKPGTRAAHKQAADSLIGYFGESTPIRDITPMMAEKWRQSLYDAKLANATIAKRTQTAKQIFRRAVKPWKMIAESPFADLKVGSQSNKARMFYIGRDVADKVIEGCPDAQWRLLFVLSRYGGLRCPSEHLALRWGDIDFEKGRILVHSPKTEHHEGGDCRVIPMFPELRGPLMDVFTEAEPGTEFVITRYRQANSNLRTQLNRIIHKAGLKPWPKLFHNLRSSRQTELAQSYPIHVVCEWIGNSRAVAQEHYLQITDADFEHAAQKAAQSTPEKAGQTRTSENAESENHSEKPGNPAPCELAGVGGLGAPGFEPGTKGL